MKFIDVSDKAYNQILTYEMLGVTESNRYDPYTLSSTPKRILPASSPRKPHAPLFSPLHESYSESAVSVESRRALSSPRKQPREIPKTPYKVLDAPDLQDDFYLNLVDWSSTNFMGVGLGTCVYLWNASTSRVRILTIQFKFSFPTIIFFFA